MDIKDDVALKYYGDDELGRKNLADLICNSINDYSTKKHPCRCFGIYGEWGAGKTTLMNFVKTKLLENGTKDNICIVDFNPWLINEQKAILTDFFNSISKNATGKIQDFFQKYGKTISFIAGGVGEFLLPGVKFQKRINGAMDAITTYTREVSQQKQDIIDEIEKSGQHYLIFIDDIDRLDKDEVHTVFRLIRQVADFPNTTYVVAMDPIIVAKSLSDFFGGSIEDGKRFIDKIIQVPIQIPAIDAYVFKQAIGKYVFPLWCGYGNSDTKGLDDVCDKLQTLFTNMRQLKKYVNQMYFVLPTLSGEVNRSDLFLLQAIRTVDVQAYYKIYESRESLLKEGFLLKKEELKEKYDTAIESIVSGINEPLKSKIRSLIKGLFDNQAFDADKDKKLYSKYFFNAYFIQDVPHNIIPNREIMNFCSQVNSLEDEQVIEWLDDKYVNYKDCEVNRVLREKLYNEKAEKRSELAIRLIKLLSYCKCCDSYGPDIYIRDGDVALDVSLIFGEFCSERKDDALKVLGEVYCDEKSNINYCLHLNDWLCERHGIMDSGSALSEYIIPLATRFQKLGFKEHIKYRRSYLVSMFIIWKKVEEKGPETYLTDMVNNERTKDLAKFLEIMITNSDNNDYMANANFFSNLFGMSTELLLDKLEKGNHLSDTMKNAFREPMEWHKERWRRFEAAKKQADDSPTE